MYFTKSNDHGNWGIYQFISSDKYKLIKTFRGKDSYAKSEKMSCELNKNVFGYVVGIYYCGDYKPDRPKITIAYDPESKRDLFEINYSDPNNLIITWLHDYAEPQHCGMGITNYRICMEKQKQK
jgi:hypothetical protein